MDIQLSNIIIDDELDDVLQQKYSQLQCIFRDMQTVIVAFSGGIDSTLALKVASDTLGMDNTLAIIAVSPSLSSVELEQAILLLEELCIPYQTVATNEIEDPNYAQNPANRCYFCKVHIGDALIQVAHDKGYEFIVDGFNRDDTGDHRPGRKAGKERGIRSPLYEAGLDKADVRKLARYLGLSNWNKPAMACLSSRIPYGSAITSDILKQVDVAEQSLRKMGFHILRVRHHDTLARLEVPIKLIPEVMEKREAIITALQDAGYTYVTLDLQGFRSGSMNEALLNNG